MINIKNICTSYEKKVIIKDISFTIEPNQIVGVLGVNGCGKSTLLKSVLNLIKHDGMVEIDNVVLESLNYKQISSLVSSLPQKSSLTIDLEVIDVVLMGANSHLSLLQHPDTKLVNKAVELLKYVGLEDYIHYNFQHLSIGQMQLVLFARSLFSGGKLLVYDEPESALDFNNRYSMMNKIKEYTSNKDSSCLVALHDPQLALNCCDKLVILNNGLVHSIINPKIDDLATIEASLKAIYGNIELQKTLNNKGVSNWVIIQE